MHYLGKKILIRGVNWIGDAVLTTPAIKAIRKAFPDAWISLLVKPWVAEVFRGNPALNEIILYEEKFNSITSKFKLARILRAKGFNTAILLQNAFDAAFITWLSGIPERIGYNRDYRGFLLTKVVPVKTVHGSQFTVHSPENKNISPQHHVYYYLNLLKESLGVEPENLEPLIYLNDEEINQARTFLNSELRTPHSKLVIGINPGATYGSAKRWMPERFAELIHRIISELNGGVVLFGSKSEAGIVEEITSRLQNTEHRTQSTPTLTLPPRGGGQGWGGHSAPLTPNSNYTSSLLNMVGKTSIRQLMALISECDAFITNDSGPMHIASALYVPIVAIFGSTDRTVTGPLGEGHKIIFKDVSCSPCLKRECPEGHLKCMTDITTGDVFNALLDVLPEHKAVFLDRDGTLIEDTGYLNSFDNLKIFEGAKENLQKLKKADFKLLGVTNQSGVARGLINEEFVKESNAYLQKTLDIDDFYYCPHHPDENCQCRKPKPMLLHKASLKHRIKLKSSYVMGDKTLDILLAKAVWAKGILVLTGHDRESKEADFIARDLAEAVDWILSQESKKSPEY